MKRFFAMIALPLVIVVGVLALTSVYIVDVREKALITRFGEVVRVREEPGIGLKLPFLDKVVTYDARILGLQTDPMEVTPLDDRRLVVDAFARWQIVDVVQFRRAVGNGGVEQAQSRLSGIMTNAIRAVLGAVPSTTVLSEDRTPMMNRIRDLARLEAQSLGVSVIDVRLTRTDLPEQNLNATYARMRAEREREAADERARGGEAAQRIRAAADRTVVELTSGARAQAEVVRGEADAERNAIYASAFGRDAEFFAFTRSMQAYDRALQSSNSSIVLRPQGEFFSYLNAAGTGGVPTDPAPSPEVADQGASAADGAAGGAVDGSAGTEPTADAPNEGAGTDDASAQPAGDVPASAPAPAATPAAPAPDAPEAVPAAGNATGTGAAPATN